MAQRYTHPTALMRMAQGDCPECGVKPEVHNNWGQCSLRPDGVADRIAQYRNDLADQAERDDRLREDQRKEATRRPKWET